ncbi:MAG: tetratricopeptide repeat protein [Nitrospirae bacterium YQR-1]
MNKTPLKIFIITVLAILAYSNTLNSPFVVDDNNLEKFCQYRNFIEMRFVTETTFVLNCKLHGLKPQGYHIVNILIHIVNGLLLFAFSFLTLNAVSGKSAADAPQRALDVENTAFLISLVFTLHPVQIQAVTYIIQRYSSLLTLMYLSSLVFYALWRKTTNGNVSTKVVFKNKYVLYSLSFFFALAATKTKESAITLPLILTAYEFLFFKGSTKKRLLSLIPFFIVIPVIIINSKLIVSHMDISVVNDFSFADSSLKYSPAKNPLHVYSISENFFTQIRAILTYIKMLILPVNFTLIYYYPVSTSFTDYRVILSGVFIMAILSYSVVLIFKSFSGGSEDRHIYSKLTAFGILWFFINISPQLMIAVKEWVVLQYRVYLPSVGFSFLAGALLIRFFRKYSGYALTLLSLGIAIILCVSTYRNNSNWQNETTLWEDNIKKAPQHPMPYNFLANAYFNKTRYNDAIRVLKQAVTLDRYDYQSLNLLGYTYEHLGELKEAITSYEHAIRINPFFAPPYINLGNIYASQGLLNDALKMYETAVKLKPDLAQTYNNMGNIYLKQGFSEKALENYKMAIAINPAFAAAHNNLGVLYLNQGLTGEAAGEFEKALEYQPDYEDAARNLNSLKRGNIY